MAYDPVKAHEYYMKHRKLKGRYRSTRGMSESQKEQWEYAKHELSEEHKSLSKGITAAENRRKEQVRYIANFKIKQIRNRLKYAPKSQKEAFRKKLAKLVDGVRADLAVRTGKLTKKAEGARANERAAYAKRKDQAYESIKGS